MILRPILTIAAAGTLGVCAAELPAQDTGSLIRAEPGAMPDNANRRANLRQGMANIASCVLKRRRSSAKAYLTTFPGTGEAIKRATILAQDDCLASGGVAFDERVFRGVLFEALYRDEFARSLPGDLSTRTVIDYSVGADLAVGWQQQEVALRRFSDCVVRKDSRTAHLLVSSLPESARENEAFSELGSSFSSCLFKDQTLRFSKVILRAVVGESLYRVRSAVEQED